MDFKSVAIEAAKAAGEIHRKYFESDCGIKTKEGTFDLVTKADVEAEENAVAVIRKSFPDHNFLAEENKYEQTDSEYKWIIDPLDGTNNFASGIPVFCVSIALAKNDEVLVGVIYDVTREEMFVAEKGKGAYLNEKQINVNDIDSLEDSILITGFYYDRGPEMEANLDRVKRFFQVPVRGVRRFGAAALDLCYVACGRVPGFWEFKLCPWDFAAGNLIVEEAGGKVTGSEGQPVKLENCFIVASNGLVHDKILEVLK